MSVEQGAASTRGAAGGVVNKSGERVRQMFGEISARYDLMNHVLSGGTDYYWRWRTIREAPPRGNAPVLDVCTGTGDLALAYARACGPEGAVIGADFTPQMLVIANRKGQRQQAGGTQGSLVFVEADTQALPFPEGSFQIVSVAFGLRNVADTRAGLREMLRVCEPGGRVVVLEFSLPGNRLLRGLYQWYFRNILPRLGQFFARNNQGAYNYLPDSVGQFPHGAELAAIIRECGASEVRYLPLTFGVATLYIATKPGQRPS
jgi:demethylmenaquinone methyltransferase/2-methoxy-6-polyprenyl-1,4-benzoquinol methylase